MKEISLIERLISNPSPETTELLFDNEDEVIWIDWREDDAVIADYCEAIIKTGKLSSVIEDDKLSIQYGDRILPVPLTYSASDRHITLVTINKALYPDYEIRMVWDANGSDTGGFAIQSNSEWSRLESEYGVDAVSKAFLVLTEQLNTFTDSLAGHRPGSERINKPWWKFWG